MTTDRGEVPLINMANVMLAVLKAAALAEVAAEDCVAVLMRQLARVHEDAEAVLAELADRVATALEALSAAGLLAAAEGGRYRLTARGRTVLEEHPMGVDDTVLAEFREFRDFVRRLEAPARTAPTAAAAPSAYLDGYSAYLGGRRVTENPHPADMNEHMAWDAGWFEAFDEALENSADAERGGGGARGP